METSDFTGFCRPRNIHTRTCIQSVTNVLRDITSVCAVSRIHGSYQALISGFANEALVDFTAGIAETASLHKLEHPYKFFRTMKRAFRRGSLLTSLIEVCSGSCDHREFVLDVRNCHYL